MKKSISFLLSVVLIVSMFTVLVSATRDEEGSAATEKSVAFEISGYASKPTIDGVISEGEYTKVELDSSWMTYVINDEEVVTEGTTGADFKFAKSTVIDFYGTYDKDNLYLAWGVHISDENYVQNWTNSLTNMHAQTALQVKIGDSYITSAWDGYDEYIKFQVARNKGTGELAGVMLHKAASVPGGKIDDITYQITWSAENELLVYEMQIPTSVWTFSELEPDGKVALCWNVCVGGDATPSWNNYTHIQLGYGCTGKHGAACNGLALVTLKGAANQEPESGDVTTAAEGNTTDIPVIQPEDSTSDTTPTTPAASEEEPTATKKPTETAEPAGTTTGTEKPEKSKSGCGSSLAMGGMMILLTVGGAIISLKRKD